MGLIPQDVIDSVLAAHDVVEVVGRYVPLKPAGRAFKALCPFHEEKTPSFTVDPGRQTWKCFGCGKGGNAIRFVIEHEGLTFPEAVRSLAKERGITVPDTRERSPEEQGRVEAVRRALALAQAFFVKSLRSSEGTEARAYLAKRGYDDAAVERFGLGYAPPAWDRLLGAAGRRGLDGRLLEEAGLAVPRREGGWYDRFRHRVTFPIQDLRGRVLTFGARALSPDDNPKYLNGPETVVFKKAHTLFALGMARDGIRRAGEALLMEGYTDVLMCHLHGIDRAVAGMGTAFTPRQAGLLKRFAARVVLVYDGDDAGRQAAERTLDILLPEGLEMRVVLLPEGRDVDEILLEEGVEAVERLVAGALDVLDFKLAVLGQRLDLSTPHGRARAAEEVVATVVKVPSPAERDQLLREVAERLGGTGTEAALRQVAADAMRTGQRPRAVGEQKTTAKAPLTVAERTQREAEEFLIAGLLFFPALRGDILRAVGAEDFSAPVMQRIYNAALRMEDAQEQYDLRVLGARLADDAEAQEVLAGLSEDPTLEDRIPFQIEYLERQRRARRRALQIRQELGDASSGRSHPGDGHRRERAGSGEPEDTISPDDGYPDRRPSDRGTGRPSQVHETDRSDEAASREQAG